VLGAERIIAIDNIPERLALAEQRGATVIDFDQQDVLETLREMTGGRGPDACIDAVGLEANAHGLVHAYDRAKQALMLETGRPHALRQAIWACRNGGTVSVPGVYGGPLDKIPLGSFMNRSLTLKTGQTHVHRYLQPLLDRVERGELRPDTIITDRIGIDDAPDAYATFSQRSNGCIKVVMHP